MFSTTEIKMYIHNKIYEYCLIRLNNEYTLTECIESACKTFFQVKEKYVVKICRSVYKRNGEKNVDL